MTDPLVADPLVAAAAIARIPGIEPATARYRTINGGFSNRLWLIEAEERTLVLRLDTPHAGALGLDRKTELAVLREAGKAGLAPEIVFADLDAGVLVYEYVPGRSWTAGDLQRTDKLEALAGLLKKVHALPRSGVAFNAVGAAKRYVRILNGGEFADFARRCGRIVAGIPASPERACCHNDVVAENIVEMPGLRLIDWEYACDNEPLFDLASLVAYHDLDDRQRDVLLRAYAGAEMPDAGERLSTQLRLFDALQWLWLAVRQTAMPTEATRDRLRQLAARIEV